jgi:hypothetical protein
MDIAFIVANKAKQQGYAAAVKAYTDCTVNITHNFNNNVTRLATEEDADFNDHIQKTSNEFEVTGVFSSATFNSYEGDVVSTTDRVLSAYRFLRNLRDDKSVFTFITNLDVFPDCTIESLQLPITPETANSLFFTMKLVQLRKVRTENVLFIQKPLVRDDKKDDAASNEGSGTKKTKEVYSTALFQTFNATGSLVEDETAAAKDIDKLDDSIKKAMKQGVGGQ